MVNPKVLVEHCYKWYSAFWWMENWFVNITPVVATSVVYGGEHTKLRRTLCTYCLVSHRLGDSEEKRGSPRGVADIADAGHRVMTRSGDASYRFVGGSPI